VIHILLPAYNEEIALGRVLENIARTLADGGFKVWVVDDGSTDRTATVAREWAGRVPLVLLRHETNAGLGAAFRTGFDRLLPVMGPADVLVTLDADDTHPAALIPRLVQPVEEGRADVAIASRYAPGARVVGLSFLRRCASRGAGLLYRLVLPFPGVRDYTCSFRAVRGDLMKKAGLKWGNLVTEAGFASAAEWLVKLSPFHPRVVEIPLVLRYDRKPTPSKMPLLRTIGRSLRMMAVLRGYLSPSRK
jgi:dolichol-phosphate mannosyltransferase